MSVTGTRPCPSRNTGGSCQRCHGCGTDRVDRVHGGLIVDCCPACGRCHWCDGRPAGTRPASRPHCLTCHDSGHNDCRHCGACMGYCGLWRPHETRADACYCTNACRQAAYRARHDEGSS